MGRAQRRDARQVPALATALALAASLAHAQPGQPLDDPFIANTDTAGSQRKPDVAAADDGRFVVAWEGIGPGDVDGGIFYRRFLADGTALDATDRRANTTVAGIQSNPAVAMDAAGNFILAWDTAGGTQISAREFLADGTPVTGTEFVVTLDVTAIDPDVATTGSGNFVVVWLAGSGDLDVWPSATWAARPRA